jgi:hypothetical protein
VEKTYLKQRSHRSVNNCMLHRKHNNKVEVYAFDILSLDGDDRMGGQAARSAYPSRGHPPPSGARAEGERLASIKPQEACPAKATRLMSWRFTPHVGNRTPVSNCFERLLKAAMCAHQGKFND